jgi:imidazolonepropionase-like amidohydrolase
MVRSLRRLVSAVLGVVAIAAGDPRAQTRPTNAGGPYGSLAIRGALLIDGTGAPPLGPVDILIERNVVTKIVRVDPVTAGPEWSGQKAPPARMSGEKIIDAAGSYVMPGIINLHDHQCAPPPGSPPYPYEYWYKLWLGHGVTSVRLVRTDYTPDQEVAWKARVMKEDGPRLFIYSLWRSATDPRFDAADPDAARLIVREWKQKGVDGVKINGLPGMYPDVLKAIVDEAKTQGLGVAVHIGQDGVDRMNALELARLGVTSIEHHYGFAESAFGDRTVQRLPADYNYMNELQRFRNFPLAFLETDLKKLHGEVLNELVDLSKRGRFTIVPTMTAYDDDRDVARAQNLPWFEKFALPQLWNQWAPHVVSVAGAASGGLTTRHGAYHYKWTSVDEANMARMTRIWMDFLNDFKNHGGRVGVGTDGCGPYAVKGFAEIREMELLEQAGFDSREVIRAATENGGRLLGNAQLGVIRPGSLADLLVLDANPLEDLKVLYGTETIRFTSDAAHFGALKYTIRDGVVYDARAMLQDVQEMVRKAKSESKSSAR